jgi:hypothetical protein
VTSHYERDISILKQRIVDEQAKSWNINEELKKAAKEINHLRATLAMNNPTLRYIKNTPVNPPQDPPQFPPKDYDPEAYQTFLRNDTMRTGRLDVGELCQSLQTDMWPDLSIKTCGFLTRIVDADGNFVTRQKFPIIWTFVNNCKDQFVKYDATKKSEHEWGQVHSKQIEEALRGMKIEMGKSVVDRVLQRKGKHGKLYFN